MADAIQIDAHQHFWHPARGDYGWMPADDPVLSRPYNPADLTDGLAKTGIRKTILVQAAPTVSETEYLLGFADATPHVAAVVGWIDFECADQIDTLRRLATHPKFVGVRPMIQDIADVNWMLRDDVQWGFQAIIDLDLTFDALGFPQHAFNFHTILRRYPQMRAVLDHCLKPQIRNHSKDSFESWAADIARIAESTKACCKFSGLLTEANPDSTPDDLRPYTDHVIAEFGADRIMWGSDWPVIRLRCEYEDWHRTAQELTNHLSGDEQSRIFGETAKTFYRLNDI